MAGGGVLVDLLSLGVDIHMVNVRWQAPRHMGWHFRLHEWLHLWWHVSWHDRRYVLPQAMLNLGRFVLGIHVGKLIVCHAVIHVRGHVALHVGSHVAPILEDLLPRINL